MNQVNYAAMSDRELRQYFLRHREDKLALRAYLDRLGVRAASLQENRPRHIITTVEDPDFEAKLEAAVLAQMQGADNNGEPTV